MQEIEEYHYQSENFSILNETTNRVEKVNFDSECVSVRFSSSISILSLCFSAFFINSITKTTKTLETHQQNFRFTFWKFFLGRVGKSEWERIALKKASERRRKKKLFQKLQSKANAKQASVWEREMERERIKQQKTDRKAERIWSKNSQKFRAVFMNGWKHKKKLQCKYCYDEKLGEFLSFSFSLVLVPYTSQRSQMFRCFPPKRKTTNFPFLFFIRTQKGGKISLNDRENEHKLAVVWMGKFSSISSCKIYIL